MPSEESYDDSALTDILDDLGINFNDPDANLLWNSYMSLSDDNESLHANSFASVHSSPSQSGDSSVCMQIGSGLVQHVEEFQAIDLPLLATHRSNDSSSDDSRDNFIDSSLTSYSSEPESTQPDTSQLNTNSGAFLSPEDDQTRQLFPCLIITQSMPSGPSEPTLPYSQALLMNINPALSSEYGPVATSGSVRQTFSDIKPKFTANPAPVLDKIPTSGQNQFYVALEPPVFQLNRAKGQLLPDENDRRQEKKMKNRMSALLSRKRKKEQFECLRDECSKLTGENNKLRRENHHLKSVIETLNQEVELLKVRLDMANSNNEPSSASRKTEFSNSFSSDSTSRKRSLAHSTVLLTLMCSLVVNFKPYMPSVPLGYFAASPGGNSPPNTQEIFVLSNLMTQNIKSPDAVFNAGSDAGEFKSININDTGLNRKKRSLADSDLDRRVHCNDSSHLPFYKAKYENETETIRLLDELNRWFIQHDKRTRDKRFSKFFEASYKSKKFGGLPDSFENYRRMKDVLLNGQYRYGSRMKSMEYKVANEFSVKDERSDVEDLEAQYVAFLNAFGRRNDTLYVVSFREDYLLWRAKEYNRTSKLRMSLFMPALAFNDSSDAFSQKNHLSMMQIECEILNLIQLPEVRSSKTHKSKYDHAFRHFSQPQRRADQEIYEKRGRRNNASLDTNSITGNDSKIRRKPSRRA